MTNLSSLSSQWAVKHAEMVTSEWDEEMRGRSEAFSRTLDLGNLKMYNVETRGKVRNASYGNYDQKLTHDGF